MMRKVDCDDVDEERLLFNSVVGCWETKYRSMKTIEWTRSSQITFVSFEDLHSYCCCGGGGDGD